MTTRIESTPLKCPFCKKDGHTVRVWSYGDASGWQVELVDSVGDVGEHCSLILNMATIAQKGFVISQLSSNQPILQLGINFILGFRYKP